MSAEKTEQNIDKARAVAWALQYLTCRVVSWNILSNGETMPLNSAAALPVWLLNDLCAAIKSNPTKTVIIREYPERGLKGSILLIVRPLRKS